jgi:hypothetical protein
MKNVRDIFRGLKIFSSANSAIVRPETSLTMWARVMKLRQL